MADEQEQPPQDDMMRYFNDPEFRREQSRARKRAMPLQKSAVAPSVLWSLPGTTCQLFGPAHAS